MTACFTTFFCHRKVFYPAQRFVGNIIYDEFI